MKSSQNTLKNMGNKGGVHNSLHGLDFGYPLTSYCILWQISIVNIVTIKCDFGADFNKKLQISILMLHLKNGHEVYYIRHFEGLILAFRVFIRLWT